MTDESLPLARLFAMAYRDLIDGLHDQLAARGWPEMRPAYGFVLVAASRAPVTTTQLAELLGMTKQAASKLAASMVDLGYLEESPAAADGRVRPLRLSASGRQLLAAVEEVYAQLESQWAQVIGERAVSRLRRDVTRVVRSQHEGTLPAIRPVW